MSWEDKPQVKMGNIGERLIRDYLEKKGLIPYFPDLSAPHPFDLLCATADKKRFCIVEIKTKPRRIYYADTGINVSVYNDYLNAQNKLNIKVYLYFVDTKMGQIYGNTLDELSKTLSLSSKKYPSHENGVVYFPLCHCLIIRDLSDEEISEIEQYTTRKYQYPSNLTPAKSAVRLDQSNNNSGDERNA